MARIPTHLSGSTDIVGFPVHSNFNVNRYFDTYYLLVLGVPFLFLTSFHALGKWGPFRRKPTAPHAPPSTDTNPDGLVRVKDANLAPGRFACVARLLFSASVVAVEASAAWSRSANSLSGVFAGALIAYVGLVAAAAALRSGRLSFSSLGLRPDRMPFGAALAEANSLASVVVVPLLYAVSRVTKVTVLATHRTHTYSWFPWWAALAISLGVTIAMGRARRQRVSTEDLASLEARVLMLLVGPTLLFLLTSYLPGALSVFDGFHEGELLGAARLTAHGYFPWRDLYFIHGLFGDVFSPLVGMKSFEDSHWGVAAGLTVLVYPLYWVSLYFFACHLFRRRWPLAAGLGAAIVLGVLVDGMARFALQPLILILLAVTLKRRNFWWTASLSALMLFQAIVTPEAGLVLPAFILVFAIYEWTNRDGQALAQSFARTLWCVITIAVLGMIWAIYLVIAGALRGFIDYYLTFASDHSLTGGIPLQWDWTGATRVNIEFWLPPVLLLITTGYIAVKVRCRRALRTEDWVTIAAALFVFLYYGKALARADPAHVGEVFSNAVPLLLLLVSHAVRNEDQLVARFRQRFRTPILMPRYPASTVLALTVVLLAPQSADTTVRHTSARLQAAAATEPSTPGLGFATPQALDVNLPPDLNAVFESVIGPKEPVFDFSNDPGLLYYLLHRTPGSRFFHVSMAIRARTQHQLIADLRRARPKLIVFTNNQIGLPTWDGIPNMVRHYDVAQYLLDNYRPLVDTHSQLVMVARGQQVSPALVPPLRAPPRTSDLYFDSPSCDWGYAPNYLRLPARLKSAPGLELVHTDLASTTPLTLAVPEGVDLSAYQWLNVRLASPVEGDEFSLADEIGVASHQVTFRTLKRAGTSIWVHVGSCLQWHGYTTDKLFLSHVGMAVVRSVRLVHLAQAE